MSNKSWYSNLPAFWQTLAKQVLSPQAESDETDVALDEAKQKLPVPVIWLLGKTQAGKTSIIRVLTGRDDAEIGQGFKSCTRSARLYEFPSSDDCLLKFLDTRGLGEIAYDPAEDLRQFQEQAHVLMLVLRAMDHNQAEVLSALREIRKAHPAWPVLVVQTALHEGYPDPAFEHPLPYPFDAALDNPAIPDDLRRSLQVQRTWFADIPHVHFVALDLTQAEENYTPVDYGATALWNTLQDETIPHSMRNLLKMLRENGKDHYAAAAHPHIIAYALMAAAAEAVPVPMVSVPVVLSAQAKMFHALASIYEQELNYERFAEIAGLLGTGYLLRLGGRQLCKFIPIYGEAVTAVYSGATTYALGHMLCLYFEYARQGKVMTQKEFEQTFSDNMEHAKQFISAMLKREKPE